MVRKDYYKGLMFLDGFSRNVDFLHNYPETTYSIFQLSYFLTSCYPAGPPVLGSTQKVSKPDIGSGKIAEGFELLSGLKENLLLDTLRRNRLDV